ncbi:hypothetical protein [Pandoraea apista]|uniref:hypothetical protein n=1 Tax=Pandoraea apista TaxID=93218 RepID=UPI00248F066A|nr:hypothetical protein [Pandoraea apista]
MDGSKPQETKYHEEKTSTVLDISVKLSSLTVLGTALFSILGYVYAKIYLQGIGASWAANLLNPTALIYLSAPFGAMLTIAILCGIGVQSTTSNDKVWLLGGLGAGLVCYCLFLASEVLKGPIASILLLAGFFIADGIVIGAVAGFARSRWLANKPVFSQPLQGAAGLIALILVCSLPVFGGKSMARLHASPSHSTLARAHLLNQTEPEWRLVFVTADKALIMKLTGQWADREFRVVSIDQIRVDAAQPS